MQPLSSSNNISALRQRRQHAEKGSVCYLVRQNRAFRHAAEELERRVSLAFLLGASPDDMIEGKHAGMMHAAEDAEGIRDRATFEVGVDEEAFQVGMAVAMAMGEEEAVQDASLRQDLWLCAPSDGGGPSGGREMEPWRIELGDGV
jgi:hypothetical protein